MILIRQRRSYECGIAVAAMLGGIPYEGVLDRLITGLAPETCLSELVMWRVLEDITQAAWQTTKMWRPWPRVIAWPLPDAAAILIQRESLSCHYIAAVNGLIYDLLFDAPFLQANYPDRSTWVKTVFNRKRA
jgi:hypothetical protein